MEIIRISVIGIAGIVLAILVKEAKPEYSFYLTFAAGIAILFFSAGRLSDLLGSIREIQQYLPIENTYMDLLLKMVGITYVGQFFRQHLPGRGVRFRGWSDRAFCQAFRAGHQHADSDGPSGDHS